MQPLRLRAFLEGDVHRAPHAGEELQQRRLLGGENAARDDLASGLLHRRERSCLVHVETHILRRASHEGRPLLRFTCVSRPQIRSRGRALNMRWAVTTHRFRRMVSARIEQLAHRPDCLATVARWIYEEWWTGQPGESPDTLAAAFREHLVPGRIPLTLVASIDERVVGTATLLEHDVGTEQWPDLSPWVAAVYVVPEFRRHGIGAQLVNAVATAAAELGVTRLYLWTSGREAFYAELGWETIDRVSDVVVMSKAISPKACSA